VIKIRLQGLPAEVADAVKKIEETFVIHEKSGEYKNRNSDYVRVYLDVDVKSG
jgi:hypothetical protein